MLRSIAIALMITPFMASAAAAQSEQIDDTFSFSHSDLDSIRFSRVSSDIPEENIPVYAQGIADRQTEFSFRMSPNKPNFSREGGFGLNMFGLTKPHMIIESNKISQGRMREAVPDLHSGFAYSAGVKIEQEDADIDGTAYVSSSLLGLSYGRLGRVWYGGVDVNLEQFSDDYHGEDQADVLSLDFTTGLRLGWTGLTDASPLWLLSLQGNFDVQEAHWDQIEAKSDWYLNPSLFWKNPEFTFSAQVQLPVEQPSNDGSDLPDYRLRAIFEKQF